MLYFLLLLAELHYFEWTTSYWVAEHSIGACRCKHFLAEEDWSCLFDWTLCITWLDVLEVLILFKWEAMSSVLCDKSIRWTCLVQLEISRQLECNWYRRTNWPINIFILESMHVCIVLRASNFCQQAQFLSFHKLHYSQSKYNKYIKSYNL